MKKILLRILIVLGLIIWPVLFLYPQPAAQPTRISFTSQGTVIASTVNAPLTLILHGSDGKTYTIARLHQPATFRIEGDKWTLETQWDKP